MSEPVFTRISEFLNKGTSAFNRIEVRSALSAPLRSLAIIPVLLGAAYIFRDDALICRTLVVSAVIRMLVVDFIMLLFARSDPGRMQSESFNLRQEAINAAAIRELTPENRLLLEHVALASLGEGGQALLPASETNDESDRTTES